MGSLQTECKVIDWIHLAQERVRWQTLMHEATNSQIS